MGTNYEAPRLTRIAAIDEITLGGGFSGVDDMSMMGFGEDNNPNPNTGGGQGGTP